jgi:hypothetical protein
MASTISLSHRSLGRIWAMVVGVALTVALTVVLVLAFAGGSHSGTVPGSNNAPNLAPAAVSPAPVSASSPADQGQRCYVHQPC